MVRLLPNLITVGVFSAIAFLSLRLNGSDVAAQASPPSFPPSGQSAPVATDRPASISVPPTAPKAPAKSGPATRPAAKPTPPPPPPKPDPYKPFMDQIFKLREELVKAREQLAKSQLDAAQSQRELDELRQFVRDHHQFGDDFTQYKAVKEVAEREAHERDIQAARERREMEKVDREARRRVAQTEKARRDAETAQAIRYRQAGFTNVGLDVFTGKMAFFYETKDTTRTRVDYSPLIGRYIRPSSPATEIDYSSMTISGSVLNGSNSIRNLGVAITFFDDNGNQVSHETVQVNNARPDVPYPFTSKIDMALNRPFDSSSVYVLYADAVDSEESAPPATTTIPTPAPVPAPQPGSGSPGASGKQ